MDKPDRALVAALVRTAVTPAEPDRSALRHLASRCWPAGSDGRPSAEGLRGWGGTCVVVREPRCGCAAGRCAWCN